MNREHIFVVLPSEIECTLKIVGFTLVISLATAASALASMGLSGSSHESMTSKPWSASAVRYSGGRFPPSSVIP